MEAWLVLLFLVGAAASLYVGFHTDAYRRAKARSEAARAEYEYVCANGPSIVDTEMRKRVKDGMPGLNAPIKVGRQEDPLTHFGRKER